MSGMMNKRNPHFEKIIIGPMMIFGEMLTGGHYVETHKILKQSTNYTYPQIAKMLWKKHKFRGFYLGFWPWTVIQTTKGLPILFVYTEVNNLLNNYTSLSDSTTNLVSGVVGGMSQGIFITPTQRLKTIIMTYPDYHKKSFSSYDIIRKTYKKGGINSFFLGLTPMVLRCGVEWGLRVYSFKFFEKKIKEYKKIDTLSLSDNFICGILGGILPTITIPFDNCTSESQKYSNKNIGIINVIKDIYKNYGLKGFVRGWTVRLIRSCHHTSWMCGLGNVLFSYIRT